MTAGLSKTLWYDQNRNRLFLIPDEEQLPSGDFILRTVTGRELRVEPESAAAFEIGEEEAKDWVKAEFGELLDGVRAGIDSFVERLKKGPDGDAEESNDS